MKRSRKIAVVSHCVLNQNSVVHDLARAPGALTGLVTWLVEKGYGIYQLPCPEMLLAGMSRPQQSYEQYNRKEFREVCISLAACALSELKLLAADGCSIELVIGINNSPSCSVNGFQGHLTEALRLALEQFTGVIFTDVPKNYDGQTAPDWLCELTPGAGVAGDIIEPVEKYKGSGL